MSRYIHSPRLGGWAVAGYGQEVYPTRGRWRLSSWTHIQAAMLPEQLTWMMPFESWTSAILVGVKELSNWRPESCWFACSNISRQRRSKLGHVIYHMIPALHVVYRLDLAAKRTVRWGRESERLVAVILWTSLSRFRYLTLYILYRGRGAWPPATSPETRLWRSSSSPYLTSGSEKM